MYMHVCMYVLLLLYCKCANVANQMEIQVHCIIHVYSNALLVNAVEKSKMHSAIALCVTPDGARKISTQFISNLVEDLDPCF